jgi:hypothetical protein
LPTAAFLLLICNFLDRHPVDDGVLDDRLVKRVIRDRDLMVVKSQQGRLFQRSLRVGSLNSPRIIRETKKLRDFGAN